MERRLSLRATASGCRTGPRLSARAAFKSRLSPARRTWAGVRAGPSWSRADTMTNLHLFELINAAPGLGHGHLALAIALADWTIYLVPVAMTLAWVRGDELARRELLQMLLSTLIALWIAQVITHLWPQPRPFALHLGTQYLAHANDPGLPSDHVTVFWSLALAAFGTRRFAVWGLPLLTLGLLVGWSRVYLGVHFPFDVLAAFPVATAGAAAAHALRMSARPTFTWILDLYHRVETHASTLMGRDRDA